MPQEDKQMYLDNFKKLSWSKNLDVITPDIIRDFFSEFWKILSPKTILDPFAWKGKLLKATMNSCGKDAKAVAVEINDERFEELQDLSKGFPVDCIHWNSVEKLLDINSDFDFIIWEPPFFEGSIPWYKAQFEEIIDEIMGRKTGEKTNNGIIRQMYDWRIIIDECVYKLNEWWYAVFVNTNGFLRGYCEKDSKGGNIMREHIEKAWVYLAWVIKVPAWVYYPLTSIATNIFIFKKWEKSDNIFVWTLEQGNVQKLVSSFFSWKSITTGKFVSETEVKSLFWDAVKAQEYIEKLVSRKKIKKIEWIKISTKLDFDEPNSVFITTFWAPKIKLSLNEKEQKGRYIQLVLPNEYDKEVFAYYYNSKFWTTLFSEVTEWRVLWSLSVWKAKELDYYYPTNWTDKLKIAIKKIQQIKASIDLQSKLLDEDAIWNLDEVYNELSKIDVLTETDYLMKLFPTIIVRPYKEYIDLKNNEDFSKAFDTLVNLVIALFMLWISIMWWWLRTNEKLFDDMKESIVKSVERFWALGLWDMVNMYASFSKAIARQMGQEGWIDVIYEIFWITDKWTIDKMIDKDIAVLWSKCWELRNRKWWHKWATSKENDKRNLALLEDYVFQLISKFERLKNVKVFLYWWKLSRKWDVFEISGTIFNWLVPYNYKLTVNDVPNDDTLYFCFAEKPISLPGLIRYGESTDNKNKVAYVYSRVNSSDKDKLDYLSYESYEEEKAYSISEVTDDLFRTLLNNSQRV